MIFIKEPLHLPNLQTSVSYYSDTLNLNDLQSIEAKLKLILQTEITSVSELENWLFEERKLLDEINEAITGHRIDFYRDTQNADKRNIFMHDKTMVQPLLAHYQANFDKKFFSCPYVKKLDKKKYGFMRNARKLKLELFRQENIHLTSREQELIIQYYEIMGSVTIEWDGERKPYSFGQAHVDSEDKDIREKAWIALAKARKLVKPKIDHLMDELIKIRHQIAVNAGFTNYRDYQFKLKNREYSVQDCYNFHTSVEKYVVPAWERLAKIFHQELNIEKYRPWDIGPCSMHSAPFTTVQELMDGVEEMLARTDTYFKEKFRFMREKGLFDIESKQGKSQGAFCEFFLTSKNAFIFSNFSPSFVALIALIHEFGHALNGFLQFENAQGMTEYNYREEVSELFSHGLELLLLDKLNVFYSIDHECKQAQREQLRRAFRMLINPLTGDLFQHWLYTNVNHSPSERDAKFLEINKRFMYKPVDLSGLEEEISTTWIDSIHYFEYPFYKIEYAISELGALQLLHIARENPQKAISLYKQGGGTDLNQSILEIYHDTGVEFNFNDENIKTTAIFLEKLIIDLK